MIESEINNNNNNKDEDKQTNDNNENTGDKDNEGKYQNRAEEEANINCSRQDALKIPLITSNKTTNEDRSKRQLITNNNNDTNRDIDVNKRDIFCLFGGNENKNNNKDDDDDVERNRKVNNTIRNNLTTTNDDDYSKYSRYVYYYPYDRDVDYLSKRSTQQRNSNRNNINKKRVNFDLIDREQEINSNYLKKICCDATEKKNDAIDCLNALNNDKK